MGGAGPAVGGAGPGGNRGGRAPLRAAMGEANPPLAEGEEQGRQAGEPQWQGVWSGILGVGPGAQRHPMGEEGVGNLAEMWRSQGHEHRYRNGCHRECASQSTPTPKCS